jgi:hypothetical protein
VNTSQTLDELTYPVSGDYVLRNELAKVRVRTDAEHKDRVFRVRRDIVGRQDGRR